MCNLNTDIWRQFVYIQGKFIMVSEKFMCTTNEDVLSFQKVTWRLISECAQWQRIIVVRRRGWQIRGESEIFLALLHAKYLWKTCGKWTSKDSRKDICSWFNYCWQHKTRNMSYCKWKEKKGNIKTQVKCSLYCVYNREGSENAAYMQRICICNQQSFIKTMTTALKTKSKTVHALGHQLKVSQKSKIQLFSTCT